MSITTELPSDADQCRTPVIFGSAANLSSATGVSGVDSDPAFSGFIKLSEIASDNSSLGSADLVADGGEIAVVAAAVVAALVLAGFPWTCMPHQAPAENNAAMATRPITTFMPGRELSG